MTTAVGWLRGLLAVGLLAGFYVLAFGLVVADAMLVLLTIRVAFSPMGSINSTWPLMVGGSIAAVFALLYGISTVSRMAEPPAGAVALRHGDAPELWQLVESVAERLQTRAPTRIYLTPEINASVSEEPRMLGFVTGDRTMYIGVPLLILLTPAQLMAVLCHEFGHYAGWHTRFGAITYRAAVVLKSALYRLEMTVQARTGHTGFAKFFLLVIGGYAKLYLRLSLAVRRRQELEADAHAAAVVGPKVTAEALRAVHSLGNAWASFLDTFVRPVQRLGFVPDDLFGAFAAMVKDPMVRRRLAELREHPAPTEQSHLDSHPPLARRLTLIEAQPAGEPEIVHEHPLLPADSARMHDVQRKLLDQALWQATALPLARWSDLAAEALPRELASLLLEAASDVGMVARPTLKTVLELLDIGWQGELAGRLSDTADPERLAKALYALVGQVMVNAGAARWEFSWTTGYLLVCHQKTFPGLQRRVQAASRDWSAVPELRQNLARLGLNVDAPVELTLRTVSAPAERISGVRISSQVPSVVVQEVERQRQVRNFTLVVLAIMFVPWVVTAYKAKVSNGYDSSRAPALYDLPTPPPYLAGTRPLVPTYTPLPPRALVTQVPSFAPQVPSSGLLLTITVERGDTLTRLACRYHTTVERLKSVNSMGSRARLRIGEKLKVPVDVVVLPDPDCD